MADPAELGNYDAIIFGTGTRFGNMTGQMRTFLDQTGSLWMSGRAGRQGRLGVLRPAPRSTAGRRARSSPFIPTLLHQGMIIVGLPYAEQRQMGLDEIKGGSPYGASTITGGKGERMPSAAGARHGAVPGTPRGADRHEAVRLDLVSASPRQARERRAEAPGDEAKGALAQGRRRARAVLFRLDPRGLDHLAPLDCFRRLELAQFIRRGDPGLDAGTLVERFRRGAVAAVD